MDLFECLGMPLKVDRTRFLCSLLACVEAEGEGGHLLSIYTYKEKGGKKNPPIHGFLTNHEYSSPQSTDIEFVQTCWIGKEMRECLVVENQGKREREDMGGERGGQQRQKELKECTAWVREWLLGWVENLGQTWREGGGKAVY